MRIDCRNFGLVLRLRIESESEGEEEGLAELGLEVLRRLGRLGGLRGRFRLRMESQLF